MKPHVIIYGKADGASRYAPLAFDGAIAVPVVNRIHATVLWDCDAEHEQNALRIVQDANPGWTFEVRRTD